MTEATKYPRAGGDPASSSPASGGLGPRLRGDTGGNHRTLAYGLAALVFVVDQLIKWMVTGPLQLEHVRQLVLLPIFNLTFVPNYGVSLGMLNADSNMTRWLLVGLTAAIAAGVAYWIWREKLRPDALALALVLGGALGNIVDRVRFGYVVDYADLHFGTFQPFLVFNIADAAITIGVLLLLLRALLTRETKTPERQENHA